MATEAKRVTYMGRQAVALNNDQVTTLVDAVGGYVPVFGLRRGNGVLNAHFIPEFRDTSGRPWSEAEHAAYWKVKLLYQMAGDYPCSPNFGAPCETDGIKHNVHGWAANEAWAIEGSGVEAGSGAAWVRFSLRSPAASLPLAYEKVDLVLPGQPAYYSLLRVRNEGAAPVAINMVRHNTLGAPFLEAGCRISVAAERFLAAEKGTEFEPTGRLRGGVEFDNLTAAPARSGGTVDAGLVPGMIGYTDFITGAIAARRGLGWSCVVNPAQRLAYLCFFPGPAGLPEGEVAGGFNDLWMQYGGRNFTPWALHDGGLDRSFCLGTENGTGGFANGLAWSRANPELLGNSTLVEIPAGGARTLTYGVALVPLDAALAAEGVRDVEAEAGALVLKGERSHQRVAMSGDFAAARAAAARAR